MATQIVMIIQEWDAETPEAALEAAFTVQHAYTGRSVVASAAQTIDLPDPHQLWIDPASFIGNRRTFVGHIAPRPLHAPGRD